MKNFSFATLLLCALALKAEPPPQPTPSTGAVTLAWTASVTDTNAADPYQYVMEWGTVSGGPYTQATNVGAAFSCTVTNLAPGTTWYFVVLAQDTSAQTASAFSNQTNFMASLPPGAPVLTTLKVTAQ